MLEDERKASVFGEAGLVTLGNPAGNYDGSGEPWIADRRRGCGGGRGYGVHPPPSKLIFNLESFRPFCFGIIRDYFIIIPADSR